MPLTFRFLNKDIPIYGLFCVLGIIFAILVASVLVKRKKYDFFDFFLVSSIILLGAFVGSKLLFFIVSWDMVIEISKNYQLLESMKLLLKGGYVFYGGLIGGAVTLFFVSKIKKQNLIDYGSIFVVVLPLGHCFGRIGCFFSGCCYGIKYWGVISYTYNQSADVNTPIGVPLLPIQLIEAGLLFLVFILIIVIYLKVENQKVVLYFYGFTYSILRFVLEFFRGDYSRGVFFKLSTSQWISFVLFVLTICILCVDIYKTKTQDKNFLKVKKQ